MIDRNEKGLFDCAKYELDMKGRLRWLPHNLIAHPLMVILPRSWGEKLHDLTLPKEPPRD